MGAQSSPYVFMDSFHHDDGDISISLSVSIYFYQYLRDMGAKSSPYVCMGSCHHDDGGGRRDQDRYSQPPRLRNLSIARQGARACWLQCVCAADLRRPCASFSAEDILCVTLLWRAPAGLEAVRGRSEVQVGVARLPSEVASVRYRYTYWPKPVWVRLPL